MNNLFKKSKGLLYIFQLQEYEVKPFVKWVFDKNGLIEEQTTKNLVWTPKAKALYTIAFTLWIASLTLLPFWFFLVAASVILKPFEILAKSFFIFKARRKLKSFRNLKVIGVTGSFGKTSTKEFLAEILSQKYKVLKTQENINTPLGIARLILKRMTSSYEIFIVEMGAYRRGDIKKIYDLVHPQIGILTGINEAHLEKFGSIENTIKTKFELIESLSEDGFAFVNVDNRYCRENYEKFAKCEVIPFTIEQARDIKILQNELEFEFVGEDLSFRTSKIKLLGRQNVLNLVCAITVAHKLGLTQSEIEKGLSQIKPLPHKLQPVPSVGSIIVIDDSYNGNPDGVAAAIEFLSLFKDRRRIYFTPGLVEMGEAKDRVHIDIGKKLAKTADLVILIKNGTTPFILAGLKEGGFADEKILVYDSREQAHKALPSILKEGDIILFQNDWTEAYY